MTAGGGAFATRAWQQVRGPASVVFLAACGCAKNAFSISFEILEKDVLSYATASFAPTVQADAMRNMKS